VVTPIVPIVGTPLPEDTPALLTILIVPLRTTSPQPGTRLLLEQQQAYQEEQQERARVWQDDTECRTAQWQGELVGERTTIEAQLTELHHCKSVLETERAVMAGLTKAQAQARVIAAAINREGAPCPTFARASQIVAMVAALLETFHAPSVDGVDKVYR
jgi:hypothetical protein